MSQGGPRVIFIAGLEHSGTTLLAFQMSRHRPVIVLGETYMLLEDDARRSFFARWGQFDDADLCSCGKRHRHCPIWAPMVADIVARPVRETKARYRDLISHFKTEDVLVDSSKNLQALQILSAMLDENAISALKVVVAVKDPRAFVTSLKKVRNLGLRGQFSAFNWWCGANEATLEYLVESGLEHFVARYEDLCLRPKVTLARLSAFVELDGLEDLTGNDNTHICMGNKEFINATSKSIRYDERWRKEKIVNSLYRCHRRAKKLNATLITGTPGRQVYTFT